MKIAVLGASGGIGKQLVLEAARRGHEVRAVVRETSALDVPASVVVHRGDLGSEAFLRGALRGADAVASALGLRLPGLAPWAKAEDPGFLDRSTAALLAAMRAEGVRRVIAVSAGGVGDSRAQMPAAFRAFIALTALRSVYPALERMEQAYLASGLDVCLVRPPGLTDAAGGERLAIVQGFEGRAQVARADVATWMLDQLERPAFDARAPLVGRAPA